MSRTGTIAEARASVRELEAEQRTIQAELVALQAKRALPEKRLAAYKAKRDKVKVLINAQNSISRSTMAGITVERYTAGGALLELAPKEIHDAIATSKAKLSVGRFGASYTAKGLGPRVAYPLDADIRTWDKASKAVARAQGKLHDAQQAERTAAIEAFDRGAKVGMDEIVADVAAFTVLEAAVAKLPSTRDLTARVYGLTDGQHGRLSIARRHLSHLSAKEPGTDCPICQKAEQAVEWIAQKRLDTAELPTKLATCPVHGRKRMPSSRIKDSYEGRYWPDLPVVWCPVDMTRYVDGKQFAIDREKEAKAAAKAAAKSVTFRCPNPECEDVSTNVPHDGLIECPTCEAEWSVTAVKIVKGKAA